MLKTKILLSTFLLCIVTWHVTTINARGKSILFSIEKKLTSNEVVHIKVFSQLKVQSSVAIFRSHLALGIFVLNVSFTLRK